MNRWKLQEEKPRKNTRAFMYEVMLMLEEILVLTGISRRTLDSLLKSPYKTIEIRNARNVLALSRIKAGEKIFLTYETFHDIVKGTEGIVAEILRVESMEQRVLWEESDEREQMICRVQLKLLGLGKVLEIVERNSAIRVKIREMLPHEMRMG